MKKKAKQQKITLWFESKKRIVKSFIDLIYSKLSFHQSLLDNSSRKVDSSFEINEQSFLKYFKASSAQVCYATIGEKILISFIQNPDGSGPFTVFFSWSVW